MTDALDVLCPVCLASPGATCRGVLPSAGGARTPTPCPPHASRKNRAARLIVDSGRPFSLRLIEEDAPMTDETIAPPPSDAPATIESTPNNDDAAGVAPTVERVELQAHQNPFRSPAAQQAVATLSAQLAAPQPGRPARPLEIMLALRCPCGFVMGLGIPADAYAADHARQIAVAALSQLIPTLADHLELLSARLERYDQVPAAKRPLGMPTRDEVIASFNQAALCPLRITAALTEADLDEREMAEAADLLAPAAVNEPPTPDVAP